MSQTPIVSVVDDDEQVRESLAALIQSMNLDVECYASGREFLDRYCAMRNPAASCSICACRSSTAWK